MDRISQICLVLGAVVTACLIIATSISAHAQAPKVVVTLKPLHSLTSMVMEGVGEPELLLDKWQNPHHFHLRPSQTARLRRADIVILLHPEVETFIKGDDSKFVKLANHLPHPSGLPTHPWLNPDLTAQMLQTIADMLAKTDPKHAVQYLSNSQTYKQKIRDQGEKLRNTVLPTEQIVTDHDAFGELRDYYQLPAMNVLETTTGEVRWSGLRKLAGQSVSCILAAHGRTPMLENLAERFSAKLLEADPIGYDIPPGPEQYFKLQERMITILNECSA